MYLLNRFKKKLLSNNSDLNTVLSLILSFLLLTLLYDVLYLSVEKMDSLVSMLYYNVVTASTVGYGDFSPQTATGKVLTAIYIPLAISLFAALLSILGTMIYKKVHRRDHGELSIEDEIEYLVLGGFKEKIESVVKELITENKRVVLLNELYETLPIEYKKSNVLWIKGDLAQNNSLKMFNPNRVKNYIFLSDNPIDTSSDVVTLFRVEKLLEYSKSSRLFVEMVNLLSLYPQGENIRYIPITKGALIGREVLDRGLLKPIERLLDNQERLNQYNIEASSSMSWRALEENLKSDAIIPIGYLAESSWSFFPKGDLEVEEGAEIKVIASSTNSKLSTLSQQQHILLVGESLERVKLFEANYLLDERYRESQFDRLTSLSELGRLREEYTHVVIFANSNHVKSDSLNYYYWRYFREKLPSAKIVVELVGAKNREELERKYENRENEFVSIFQIGLMVQELQDDGVVHLIENLNNEQIKRIGEIEI